MRFFQNNLDFKNGSGQKLYQSAKKMIPGGTQLLSKRPEMFAPEIWPAYYSKAKGSKVWDLDGNKYIDMSIVGIGANILGFADKDVDKAVINSVKKGVSSSLNCPEEVELANILTDLHPWADMVRYARSGGEAMGLAVRVARAHTNRDIVLFSGYHGWEDWYLSSNIGNNSALDGQLMDGLAPTGVPRSLKGTSLPFFLDDIDDFYKNFKGLEDKIAAIIIEPARGNEAPKELLNKLKKISDDIGSVLIFDEITSGFRMCAGGIHLKYGINPDIAVFAKSIANGYAMSVILGTKKVMNSAQSSFISSTNWTERIGPTAAIATIKKYIKKDVASHIINIGTKTQKIWQEKSDKYHLDLKVSGIPTLCAMEFPGKNSQKLNTFFVIEMLKLGFLGFRQFKPSYAHSHKDLKLYSTAVDLVFEKISKTSPEDLLASPVAHSGFFRLTKE
ncbi:aminotransferase class III-fold pyridoxal phosphate-dependent enzyme [Flavobacteriaceae bacterium]|nr:aminotransferase class III-fold pyridoxal phosphate-dependent enzyme [Flavobacteriaceae bacterium]